ncbi:MAG: hypothetical protein R3C14_46555 [Caldilineaceae bacterium]
MKRKTIVAVYIVVVLVILSACVPPIRMAGGDHLAVITPAGINPALPQSNSVVFYHCTARGCDLRLVDPATGTTLPAYAPVPLNAAIFSYSPDRRTLAVIDYGKNQSMLHGMLKLVDLTQWQVITTTLTFDYVKEPSRFTPDGKAFLVTLANSSWPPSTKLQRVDLERLQVVAEQSLAFSVRQLHFSDDGSRLYLYGIDGSPDFTVNPQAHVAIVNSKTLQSEWNAPLPDLRDGFYNPDTTANPHADFEHTVLWEPATVFAPDGARLYIVHADANRLTTVNFADHAIKTNAITQPQSWLERLLTLTARPVEAKVFNGISKQAAIAPDGKRLYVVAWERSFHENQYQEIPHGLQVIDLARQTEIAHIESAAASVSVAPDGKQLYLHCCVNTAAQPYPQEWTDVLSAADWRPLARLEQRAITLGQRLDGAPILLASTFRQDGQWEAAALDPQSLHLIHAWTQAEQDGWGWFVTPETR